MEREEQKRIQRIYTHPLYVQALAKLKAFEKERIYCRHEETHFLSVARLSYIKWLETHLFDKSADSLSKLDSAAGAGRLAVADDAAGIRLSGAEEIKTLLYAAAFLHDIGRACQYEDGTPHAKASRALALRILPDAGFTEAEQNVILCLIDTHQSKQSDETSQSQDSDYEQWLAWLSRLFCEADRQSRDCYCCPAAESCYWPQERRNCYITE